MAKSIADKRDYKNRLLEDVNQFGIEYIFNIIPEHELQKFYMCKDWRENKHYSRQRVSMMHKYEGGRNFTEVCGCKSDK